MRLLAVLLLLVFSAPAPAQEAGPPGQFDYYVLSLSWSPTWCASKAGREDAEQCAAPRPYGLVVHGLWPQYARGGYPAECAVEDQVPPPVVESMLPLMPSRKLIQHEWARHGTCAGTTPEHYFARTRQAFERVRLPRALAEPAGAQTLPVAEVEKMFAVVNPGLDGDAVAVVCRGRYAAEIRLCLDKDLNFRACGRDVRDRCKGDALFPFSR